MAKVRATTLQCDIEGEKLTFAVKGAVYLINKLFTKANDGFQTPSYETWYNKKLNL